MKNFLKLAALLLGLSSLAFGAVNLNTATKEELMALPDIGEVRANAIIKYRAKNNFKSVDDLKNVEGIGEGISANLKDDVKFSGASDTTNIKAKSLNVRNGAKRVKKASDALGESMNKTKRTRKKASDEAVGAGGVGGVGGDVGVGAGVEEKPAKAKRTRKKANETVE